MIRYRSASYLVARTQSANLPCTHLCLVYGERLLLQHEPLSEEHEAGEPFLSHANQASPHYMSVERSLGVAIGRSAYPSVIG